MKKLVDASYESNIKTNVEEYVSSENIHFDEEVVLPKVSKLSA